MADHCELSVRQVSESTGRLNDGASGMVKVGSWPSAALGKTPQKLPEEHMEEMSPAAFGELHCPRTSSYSLAQRSSFK